MADNGFKINKSVNFNPQASTPVNPLDGDFYYDSAIQSFSYYHSGAWANFDSVGTVSSALWMTGADFTPTVVRNSVIKVIGGAAVSHLTGISSSFSARKITVHNAGAYTIVIEHEDTVHELTSNNRIVSPTGANISLVAGEIAVFMYDVASNRWLLVSIASNAGAQVIATNANAGMVTLHKASLFPLLGIALSDGDLNVNGGVVGLSTTGTVVIAAPTAATTALTVTAYNSGTDAAEFNGILSMGAKRIRNMADPTLAQDAATMAWTSTAIPKYQNIVINGNMRYWQRTGDGSSRTLTANNDNIGWIVCNGWWNGSANVTRMYGPDRFYAALKIDSLGPTNQGNYPAMMISRAASGLTTDTAYAALAQLTGGRPGSLGTMYLCQDLDREFVKRARGKKITLFYKMARAPSTIERMFTECLQSDGNEKKNITTYTGTTISLGKEWHTNASIPTTLGTTFTHLTTTAVSSTATTLAITFGLEIVFGTDPLGGAAAFRITDLVALIGDLPTAPETYLYAGGGDVGELALCRKFLEKSYDYESTPSGLTGSEHFFCDAQFTTKTATPSPRFLVTKWRDPDPTANGGFGEFFACSDGTNWTGDSNITTSRTGFSQAKTSVTWLHFSYRWACDIDF